MVRKSFAFVTAVAALTLTLAGCTSTPAEQNTTKVKAGECAQAFDKPTPALDVVSVTGKIDLADSTAEKPTITVPKGLAISGVERKVLTKGDGPTIIDTRQLAKLSAFVTATNLEGQVLYPPAQLMQAPGSVDQWGQLLPGMPEALLCARQGDRIAIALGPDHVSPGLAQQFQLNAKDGVIVVVDVNEVLRPSADGKDVFNADMGMPAVIRDTNGRPGVVVPKGKAPTEPRSQTLLRGDGEKLTADSKIYAHVLAVGWTKNTALINTWASGEPRDLPVSSFPAPVAKALTGATVGSEIQVVVPLSALSAEEASSLGGPDETAVVFVLDIVGTAE